MKKFSEHEPTVSFVSEFAQIASNTEAIEKKRYELQEKLWSEFILPISNEIESDQKENEIIEKNLKNTFSKLDSKLKKEEKNLKKNKKKKNPDKTLESQLNSSIERIKKNQNDLVQYYQSYKEKKYLKWLTPLSVATNYHKEFYKSSLDILENGK